ncbi:hypothetical protein GYH30_043105 [Glycine max]|uniref:Uncharacterized protein n=2 Tax=Glycine subgen. Soja TaxID=1462606 RepID=A0A0R0G4J9_SOYBN|nr:hypothetical protein GYH30_043105 [Glycine max]RZB65703.1 hypothetical protein D0Y65_041670 [Glycine soja]
MCIRGENKEFIKAKSSLHNGSPSPIEADAWDFHVIFSNCKILNITYTRVSFVRKQANHVAYKLTRASRLYACNQVFDYIPTFIHSFL